MQMYACDLETTGLSFLQDSIICFGYYSPTDRGVLVTPAEITEWLETHKEDGLIWQNGKFDLKFIKQQCGIFPKNTFDTLVAASLLKDKPMSLGLESLVGYMLGLPPWKDNIGAQIASNSIETIKEYCLTDCEYTYRLAIKIAEQLKECGQDTFFYKYLMPLANLLARVEYTGIGIDLVHLKELFDKSVQEQTSFEMELYAKYRNYFQEYEDKKVSEKLSSLKKITPEIEARHRDKLKFNFNSNPDKLWLLTNKFNVKCVDFKGKVSISSDVLDDYAGVVPLVDDLLKLGDHLSTTRLLDRLLNFTKNNRIHTNFNLDVARTGRLSSSDPPLQNITSASSIRGLFVAKPGYKLAIADYSQIEAVLAAHFSADPKMCQIFKDNVDLYAIIAIELLKIRDANLSTFKKDRKPERDFGKLIGLSILYGMGPKKLAYRIQKQMKKPCSYRTAIEYINIYFNSFSGLKDLQRQVCQEVKETGAVTTLFGRKIFLTEDMALRKGVNSKIQPSASDLCAFTQLLVEEYAKEYDSTLIHLVHDESIYEVKEENALAFSERLKQTIEKDSLERFGFQLRVPIRCEVAVGDSWASKK